MTGDNDIRGASASVWSSPSKVFLGGEYAVLWGGQALVLAVEPRLSVACAPRADRYVTLRRGARVECGLRAGASVAWDGAHGADFEFAREAVGAWCAVSTGSQGWSLCFGEVEGSKRSTKLGLGGSAAVTVATVGALRGVAPDQQAGLLLALLAHAKAQGGRGSGADVAAAWSGGLAVYRKPDITRALEREKVVGTASALAELGPIAVASVPPSRFPCAFVYTGHSASTRGLVDLVQARTTLRDREVYCARSDVLVDRLRTELTRSRWDALAEVVDELQALMTGLPGVVTDQAVAIVDAARRAGACAKVSGAGGGDGCVVFAPDQGALDAVSSRLRNGGFEVFALRSAAAGVSLAAVMGDEPRALANAASLDSRTERWSLAPATRG